MITLFLPGLIWPPQALADLTHDLPLPGLTWLLGHASAPKTLLHDHGTNHAILLAEAMHCTGNLPAAANLRRMGLGIPCDGELWLCLDPVHLRIEQRALLLDDPDALALTADESIAFMQSLAEVLKPLGQFDASSSRLKLAPQAWHFRLTQSAPCFPSLTSGTGHPVLPLPREDAYAIWRTLLNEAQMLLHQHPVNQSRLAAGLPIINSLWPWGNDAVPRPDTSDRTARKVSYLYGGNLLARGLAQHAGIGWAQTPESFDELGRRSITSRANAHALVVLDTLERTHRLGDGNAWRESLEQLEQAWFSPLHSALKAGKVDVLRLILPHTEGVTQIQLHRHDRLKFWRSPLPLASMKLHPADSRRPDVSSTTPT